MNNGKPLSRRTTLRGAMLLALTATSSLFSKQSANAADVKIVKLSKLPIGGTFTFTTNAKGIPAIAFRTKAGVFAYSMICTHQGCTVTYAKKVKKLVCACHGAQFDPTQGAKPVAGPAETPLASIKVAVKGGWVIEA
jgi:thiosulfate dehydrogenase [quinone] large subunit